MKQRDGFKFHQMAPLFQPIGGRKFVTKLDLIAWITHRTVKKVMQMTMTRHLIPRGCSPPHAEETGFLRKREGLSTCKSKYRPWYQISLPASSVPRSSTCWGVPSPNPAALPYGSFFLCPALCSPDIFSFRQMLCRVFFRLRGGGQYGEKI